MTCRRPLSAFVRRRPILACAFLAVVVVLIGVRFVGSPIATRAANHKLASLPEYTGHVEGVYLSLWRGTVSFTGLELSSRRVPEEGPVLRVEHASLSLGLGPLLRGELGGRALIEDSMIAILPETIAGESKLSTEELDKKRKQLADDARRWQTVLQEAFPMDLSRFEIRRLRVRFKDRSTHPPAEISLEGLHLVLTGLRNRPSAHEALPAHLAIDAHFSEGGILRVEADADPLTRPPRFTAKMEVRELALPPLNGFAMAYADANITRGTFDVFAEVEAANGGYHGYVKPFFRDLEFEPVPEKNLLKRAAVAVADAVKNVLKNDAEKVATKIPFEGNFENTDVEIWASVESALRNAFIQALREGLESRGS